jgi:3-oxoadipate enol-lactonase
LADLIFNGSAVVKEYTITIRNYPYHIRESGEGIPFIWLHGMFHSLDIELLFSVFDFQLLSGYTRLIKIELPGHGNSPHLSDPERLTWPELAADIRAIASSITTERYFAGGFSQGAGIATHLALDNPQLRGLIVMMLPGIWGRRQAVRKTYSKLVRQLEVGADKALLERLFKLVRYIPLTMGWQEETAGKINQLMLKMPPENIRTILEGAIRSDLPDPEDIRKIQVPLLMGAWKDDPNHPVEIPDEFYQLNLANEIFIMSSNFNVKPATFRLLSFIFTYL